MFSSQRVYVFEPLQVRTGVSSFIYYLIVDVTLTENFPGPSVMLVGAYRGFSP